MLFLYLSYLLVELFLALEDGLLLVGVDLLCLFVAFDEFLLQKLQSFLHFPLEDLFFAMLILTFFLKYVFQFEILLVFNCKFLLVEYFNILQHLLVFALELHIRILGVDL